MESTPERTHDRTEEEEDLLVMSNKKMRADDNKPEVQPLDVEMTTKDNAFTEVSFKEKILGQRLENLDEDLISEDKEDEGSNEDEEMDRDCPTIRLLKEENVRIRLPWKKTLIIKLLGRSIGYNLLLKKINDLWRPKVSITLVSLDNGFFIAKFSSKDDYNYAKFEGPWMIFNHNLTVQQWQSNFDIN